MIISVSRKTFDEQTRGAIGTRISDEDGNLYMPDGEQTKKTVIRLKRIEGKKLVWNEEGTRKIIIKV